MPRLRSATVDAHRVDVTDAILDAFEALAAERGPLGITMSAIALRANVGRATLYRYFPDLEAIGGAWHRRTVTAHLSELRALAQGAGPPMERLRRFLLRYCALAFDDRNPGLVALVAQHGTDHDARGHAERALGSLLEETSACGATRTDVPIAELAAYCLAAASAAPSTRSAAARQRLVGVILRGLSAAPR